MSPVPILNSISRLKPGHMLDIGARDCSIAKHFAEIGYTVDAIDPYPPADMVFPDGITYQKRHSMTSRWCSNKIVAASRSFGATAKTPSVWIYAKSDRFFGRQLVKRVHTASGDAGGQAEFHLLPTGKKVIKDETAVLSSRGTYVQMSTASD